jgi:hypothetical protein
MTCQALSVNPKRQRVMKNIARGQEDTGHMTLSRRRTISKPTRGSAMRRRPTELMRRAKSDDARVAVNRPLSNV